MVLFIATYLQCLCAFLPHQLVLGFQGNIIEMVLLLAKCVCDVLLDYWHYCFRFSFLLQFGLDRLFLMIDQWGCLPHLNVLIPHLPGRVVALKITFMSLYNFIIK